MNTTKFTIKLITKIIIYAIISAIALTLLFASPVISNELAMTQMGNSNELYLLMENYNRIKHLVSIVYGLITTLFVGTTIYDTYKFINK